MKSKKQKITIVEIVVISIVLSIVLSLLFIKITWSNKELLDKADKYRIEQEQIINAFEKEVEWKSMKESMLIKIEYIDRILDLRRKWLFTNFNKEACIILVEKAKLQNENAPDSCITTEDFFLERWVVID